MGRTPPERSGHAAPSRWPKSWIAAASVLAAGATVVLILNLTPGSGGSTGGGAPSGDRDAGAAPAGPARTGPAPSAIPGVREWKAQRGPGWEPGRSSRVVADPSGPFADEGRLLARELGIRFSGGPARTGDVELAPGKGATGREGYVLRSRAGKVRISARTGAGAFYGTRTLLQTVRDQGRFADGTVRDRPDRPQRGFLLDIARKPFSEKWIAARIREMGDLKLNQLQLHVSDDQGFRIGSDSHPEVVSENRLTKKQVRRIVELAAERHITVIPEFDSPGHLGAVLRSHPEVQLKDASGSPVEGAVDIADPRAGRLMDDLFEEYAGLFPGRTWHLGGDEYPALMRENPSASFPSLAAAARKRFGAGADVGDLATSWLNDRARAARKAGKHPEVWNDGMHRDGEVKPDRERHVAYWTGKEYGARQPEEYLKEGWKTVNLNDEYLYYVLGEPNDFTYPTGERIYKEWTPAVMRGSDPVPRELSGPDRILGGRFAVWGDLAHAQTADEVAEGIRMPLKATAQKLWNPEEPPLGWEQFKKLADRVEK